MTAVSDPDRRGLVPNLSRPGGNVTGFTLDPGAEIAGKMVELLKEAAPRVTRVALLSAADPTPQAVPIWNRHADAAAKALGLGLQSFFMEDSDRVADVLSDISRAKPDALMTTNAALVFTLRRPILDFAKRNQLPAVYPFRPYGRRRAD
jgi:ABC-type uncharacterized transport system substrate-binding protein